MNSNRDGANGGSGGGGGNAGTGGVGSQGNNGGSSSGEGGGGGGANSVGGIGGSYGVGPGGNGGSGISNSISGSSITYGGGGGGGTGPGVTAGTGGSGGGGNGGSTTNGSNGTNGLGGGGGGGPDNNPDTGLQGGNGGSGVVIVSYSTTSPIVYIDGNGTTNRLGKFTSSTTISDALLSDDGSNTTLTSGNFFMPVGSILDTVTSGALSFGTSFTTTMTFGSSSQKMIINSKVGISTTSPTHNLEVSGSFFANIIRVLANGLGLDTWTAGNLSIGSTTATSISLGRANATTTAYGPLKVTSLYTVSNCSSTTTPGTCGSAISGSVAMPTGGNTLVVNTSAVTANSQIFVMEDVSLGVRLGITCNNNDTRRYRITSRIAGTSFTITASANPSTNKACLSYFIVN